MTEAEWLAGTDPGPMLEFLRGKVSDRKLRLFACACCRRIWHLLPEEASRQAVRIAEAMADGACEPDDLSRALRSAQVAEGAAHLEMWLNDLNGMLDLNAIKAHESLYACQATNAALYDKCLHPKIESNGRRLGAWELAIWVVMAHGEVDYLSRLSAREKDELSDITQADRHLYQIRTASDVAAESERQAQVCLLQCVIGNPARPITPGPIWQTPNAVTLACTIYYERRFELLPLLADLLEEAGCPAEVSAHCRGPGPHARGCWVVDLVLGKE